MNDITLPGATEHSATTAELYKALFLVQGKLGAIRLDSTNSFTNSKYASLAAIMNALIPPLQEAGLLLTVTPVNSADFTRIGVKQMLIHVESGEFIADTYWMPVVNANPQAHASMHTYLRRYMLNSRFSLSFKDEDDDGNVQAMAVTQQPSQAAGDTKARSSAAPEPAPEQKTPWKHPDNGQSFQVGRLCKRYIDRLLELPSANIDVAESEGTRRFTGEDLDAFRAAIAFRRKQLQAQPGNAVTPPPVQAPAPSRRGRPAAV